VCENKIIKGMLKRAGIEAEQNKTPAYPVSIDLRPWCAPIENQGCGAEVITDPLS
jgi:hypothetical protein